MSLSNVWDALASLVLYQFCSAVGVYIEVLHHGGVSSCRVMMLICGCVW